MTKEAFPIIFLWVHPRSRSTAVERIFMERGDFTVFHEPFSVLYHLQENNTKTGNDFEDDISKYPGSYEEMKNQILEAGTKGPVFVKDMAFHSLKHVLKDEDFLLRVRHAFLIRNPADSITSCYAMNPETTQEEFGYESQAKLFQELQSILPADTEVPILDADEFVQKPEEFMAKFCRHLGIDFLPQAMQWEKGMPEEWKAWQSWHVDAAESNRIEPKKNTYEFTIHNNDRIREMHDLELPHYRKLWDHRLRL